MNRYARKLARLSAEPLRRVYYRYLYGRSTRLARAVGRWLRRREATLGWGDVPLSRATWEQQYRTGAWAFLHQGTELPRYQAIAERLQHHRPGGSVLDVGCGEGLLHRVLAPAGYAHYTGVDLSAEAVARAAEYADEKTRFLLADAERYRPDRRYDAIVFNECLYYFRDPLATAQRYAAALASGGVLIASMFETVRTEAIARQLTAWARPLEEAEIPHSAGAWRLLVLSPPASITAPPPGT